MFAGIKLKILAYRHIRLLLGTCTKQGVRGVLAAVTGFGVFLM